jgi:hypothetical protein
VTESVMRHPDLLRRFVATPYVFNVLLGGHNACMRSNDLEIALSMRRLCLLGGTTIRDWKIIRDAVAPAGGKAVLVLRAGSLRTLYQGTGTVLAYDQERSELLGFVAPDVDADHLVSSLIPTLVSDMDGGT